MGANMQHPTRLQRVISRLKRALRDGFAAEETFHPLTANGAIAFGAGNRGSFRLFSVEPAIFDVDEGDLFDELVVVHPVLLFENPP